MSPAFEPRFLDDCASKRAGMVQSQLLARGLRDERVLAAMRQVPREAFVPPQGRATAYADRPADIGHQQTISQPFTVAFMAEALQLQGTEKVLEIGAGSGYGAAVLSHLADIIYTIERIPELAEAAAKRLVRLDYGNVHVFCGDGSLGLPEFAPYDAICVTAAAEEIPPAYFQQLAEGGRLLIPVGPSPWRQQMLRCTKRSGQLTTEDLGPFAFVPLVAGPRR
jgi:protein-L-isoaspartate(D-aspartate) O-methyltransferase